ncbi:hypothetical protein [Chitinophaga rhizophila]|uniref:Uncharacterized protein n=1 Tax=Chitinophaga rhizophila TaxID=2866212 RepID=A0ABS7G7D9_9BACT|nr:hypothetical protein [Chitinophaga rhizophila]MBW8683577.1 hypothetical protein [Chitinophaga rhizophila]
MPQIERNTTSLIKSKLDMKYYRLLLLVLMLGITQFTIAQKKVLLKMIMAPNKTYKTLMTNVMDMEMTVKGDSAMIAQITSSGMQLPIVMHMTQDMVVSTKTGAQGTDKKMPITMTYDKVSLKQSVAGQETIQDTNPFADAVIEGSATADGKISVDTIKGSIDEALKTSLRQLVNTVQGNVKFPGSEMKVGDSFEQEVPMNLPIPQADMKMKINTKYILKEIKDNKAIFDLKHDIVMDLSMDQNDNKGNGVGTGMGIMVFDMSKNTLQQSDSDIRFTFDFAVSGMTMSATCKGKTSVKVNMQ